MKKLTKYQKINIRIYWMDYILSLTAFLLFFSLAILTNNIVVGAIASIFIYRAGAFTHEIAHQFNNPHFKVFKTVWDFTMGALIFQPSIRFAKPHLMHHKTGVFATKQDPQYPLIRSNKLLAFTVFFILPWVLPIYNILICIFHLINNDKLESILYNKVHFDTHEKDEIYKLEALYLVILLIFVATLPGLIIPYYFVSVGGWFLSVLRIPLEHPLSEYKKTSVAQDQKVLSKTHESLIYIPIQPLALRYHKAHHMFPKVPYHNLPDYHYELKYTDAYTGLTEVP